MPKTRSSATELSNRRVAVADLRRHVFSLACEMEEPLSRALAYSGALELIGFGLNRTGDDHGQAVLAIAEAMTADLEAVQKAWRQIMAAGSSARRRSKRRPKA